ncbi:SRPBCC family protein [Nocardioides daeguensis]|uniref:Carbon monoxide dehydrogenase n=1 Tax=Nocardioides daeguensis TaxID=908359 RepID=A0ABP6W976_9ACTN|nr:carbon monoxide dehydrogenase subunit G [Nocardioides daeguensis]MBV6727764.1 carbon monoxide dehydrogenase subunit G [Nocardioides daeguensis]MCR1775236.1 carbon monoxide dehydrogenase subunit G [Nocardioides daeguensis]
MKISGQNAIAAPVDKVWEAILDPRVLVATIPGCEQLEATGENAYAMTVSAGVAAIKGTYSGSCLLQDLRHGEGLTMKLKGAGAPGTIDATVLVSFKDDGAQTVLSYDADAVVGGMIGGVGQRMLTSVSRRMAAEFFGNVEKVIAGGLPAAVAAAEPAVSAEGAPVYAAAPKAAAPSAAGGESFLLGVAVGGGLVLAGVIVGGLLGRRR